MRKAKSKDSRHSRTQSKHIYNASFSFARLCSGELRVSSPFSGFCSPSHHPLLHHRGLGLWVSLVFSLPPTRLHVARVLWHSLRLFSFFWFLSSGFFQRSAATWLLPTGGRCPGHRSPHLYPAPGSTPGGGGSLVPSSVWPLGLARRRRDASSLGISFYEIK